MPAASHILMINDDHQLRHVVAGALSQRGHRLSLAHSGPEAYALMRDHIFQLVITGLNLSGGMGDADIVSHVKEYSPSTPVIAMTEVGSADEAAEALRRGAFEVLEKSQDPDNLLFAVDRALEKSALVQAFDYLRHEQPYLYNWDAILAESPAMKRVISQLRQVARSDVTVLLTGETGTGKSFLGGAIHFNSARKSNNIVTVNCAALAETLLESELFGHEKGAFTGAHKARTGRFQQAHGGTIFLDEIADMSPALQAKVLRVIEDKVIQRVGGMRSVQVDVRIMAATNRNLPDAVVSGEFREDLYYRINVAQITLPPLRNRKEDIMPLAERFIVSISAESKVPVKELASDAREALLGHSWPGNIREMRNTIERALLFAPGRQIHAQDLEMRNGPLKEEAEPQPPTLNLEQLERLAIETALRQSGWVQRQAAKLLGITPRGLSYKLDKFAIDHPELAARRRKKSALTPADINLGIPKLPI